MTLKNNQLRFDESVENLSGEELEFQWGQHLVLGGPFIDPGMEIIVTPGERIEIPNYPGPTYRYEVKSESEWPSANDSSGLSVDVSILGVNDGTDGHLILGPMKETSVIFRNHSLNTDIKMLWDKKTFPYCWIWMVLGGIKEWPLWGRERLITIEPFSSPVISLNDAIQNGSALSLGAHKRMSSWVTFEIERRPSQRETG